MAVEIVYETHSTTTDNEADVATGWQPGRLSRTGRRQAQELGDRRKNDGIAAVVTSDLARAVETAQLAFADTGIPVYQDDRLRECDYGELTGMPVGLLARMRHQHIDVPFPGGESYRDVVRRTGEFLDHCASRWDGCRIVVVAHSANRWAMEHLLAGAALEDVIGAVLMATRLGVPAGGREHPFPAVKALGVGLDSPRLVSCVECRYSLLGDSHEDGATAAVSAAAVGVADADSGAHCVGWRGRVRGVRVRRTKLVRVNRDAPFYRLLSVVISERRWDTSDDGFIIELRTPARKVWKTESRWSRRD